MRTRIVNLGKRITSFLSQARRFAAPAASGKVQHCDAHMNELPIPCGPWEPFYKKKQALYTKTLIAGFVWWLFSLVMMLYTDSFNCNWSPPRNPGPPSDMVDECVDE